MIVHPRLKHLINAGIMGKLVATYDWKNTSLGDPETWPQSLVSAVGIVLQNKIAMYIMWGKECIQIYNDAYMLFLGNKHPHALGNSTSVTWSEVWETISPLIDKVHQGQSTLFEDMPMKIDMNGKMEDRFFTFSYGPIFLEDGSIGGVLDTVIDTTNEFKQKELFRNYQELSPNPFFSIGKDWTFSYMNPSALLTLSRTKEQVIGKNIWEAFPGLEESVFGDAYKRSMNGENVSVEGYYSLYDHWYSVTSYPLHPGVAVTFQDITERRVLENDLNKAVAARDEFLSIASHELKTPITSWKIRTQSMMREMNKNNPVVMEPERLKKYFMLSDNQVSRITRLVDEMLDVSRIGTGRLQFQFTHDDMKNILEETLERMAAQFEMSSSGKPQIEFVGKDFSGHWDGFRIEQVITNLFTNALRYGEGHPIRVELTDLGDSVRLIVSDKGKGISEADKKVIFERFMRAGNTEFQQGLGLGLYIAKEIVTGHKGTIEVESSIGEGATFKVTLPKN